MHILQLVDFFFQPFLIRGSFRSTRILTLCSFYYASVIHFQAIQSVLLGVVKGLDALHQNNLVHGAIHPANVFIRPDDGKGILAEYDFTKSLVGTGFYYHEYQSSLHFFT